MSGTAETSDLMAVSDASKRLGLGRDYGRELAIKSGIAIRRGGSDEHPWLYVRLRDLERAFLRQIYRPAKKRVKLCPHPIGLNPLVKC